MGNTHANSASDQHGFASPAIHEQDCRDRREKEQYTADATGEKRGCITSESEVLEDEGRIVEDGVDSRPLI